MSQAEAMHGTQQPLTFSEIASVMAPGAGFWVRRSAHRGVRLAVIVAQADEWSYPAARVSMRTCVVTLNEIIGMPGGAVPARGRR